MNLLSYKWVRDHASNIRIHGNRFIQLDLDEKGDERLHIWSDFVPLAQRYPTPIHNHIFGFDSAILAGTLIHVPYTVFEADKVPGRYNGLSYLTFGARTRERQDTMLEALSAQEYHAAPSTPQILEAGYGYFMKPLEYHASAFIGFAVTHLVKNSWARATPNILCPKGKLPDNAFTRYQFPEEMLWDAVRDTLELTQ